MYKKNLFALMKKEKLTEYIILSEPPDLDSNTH